jgi:hypothetical protein
VRTTLSGKSNPECTDQKTQSEVQQARRPRAILVREQETRSVGGTAAETERMGNRVGNKSRAAAGTEILCEAGVASTKALERTGNRE